MASATFDEHAGERRPTVQVGDPFTEKLLLEACLEVMRTGASSASQDMAAAGLACCTSEMPARSAPAWIVELSRVPQRETGMTPYESCCPSPRSGCCFVAARAAKRSPARVFEVGATRSRSSRPTRAAKLNRPAQRDVVARRRAASAPGTRTARIS